MVWERLLVIPGSLLCQLWHGWLHRIRLAAALDERLDQPLLTVWTRV